MRRGMTILAGLVLLVALPLGAQRRGPKKEFAVAPDRAMPVTREVLVRQGFEVVRIETVGNDRVIYYRRGNMGTGKGRGRVERLVVRRVENRIVFVDTPETFLVQIDLRLKL